MKPQSQKPILSRRHFLKLAGFVGGAATLAACAPQVVTQVVTQIVKETQVVNQTQVVKETAVVMETQLVNNVVTATPAPTAAPVSGALTIAWPNDAVNGPIYEAMWRQFQTEHPDIKVNLIWNGDQNKLMAAGTPPTF